MSETLSIIAICISALAIMLTVFVEIKNGDLDARLRRLEKESPSYPEMVEAENVASIQHEGSVQRHVSAVLASRARNRGAQN